MPEITIRFEHEEEGDARTALKANKLYAALWNIQNFVRSHNKHGEYGERGDKAIEEIYDFVKEESYGLLDE